jgi:hypothetical protein
MALNAATVYTDVLQQLYQLISWLILTHTTHKASRGSQLHQGTGNIGWSASWVRRPGFNVFKRSPQLISQTVK